MHLLVYLERRCIYLFIWSVGAFTCLFGAYVYLLVYLECRCIYLFILSVDVFTCLFGA